MNQISTYILYKDHHFILALKPAGIPVQEDKTGDASFLRMLQAYSNRDLFLCNRIDRPVSGLVLLAKTPQDQTSINAQMENGLFYKTYLALIQKKDISNAGHFKNYMIHDTQNNKARIVESADIPGAKLAVLNYKCLLELDKYLLIEITTETGRFHQIRCQLAHHGLFIKGDVKYGARRNNKDRSIGLHSWKLSFHHPTLNKELSFEAPLPDHDIWPNIKF